MTAEELWKEFCEKRGVDIDTPYEAWAFGDEEDEADKLAELVIQRKKFGTASAYDEYEAEDALDELPQPGDYSVILWGDEEAACVIKTYEVYIRPFAEVPPFHAYAEGEGDRSLEYWRQVHTEAFTEYLDEIDRKLNDESRIICEKFTVEYVPGETEQEDELIFAEPSLTFADEIAAYRQEMLDADSSFDGCFSMKRMPDVKEYADYCTGWSNPRRKLDANGARGTVILCIRKSDGRMVGCMQVHNVLNENMANVVGHVGYSVRPSERRKGYAKRMLAKAKDYLSSFGFTQINLACLPDNEASRRTILANGGEYLETVHYDRDDVDLQRYRIRL